MTTGPGVTDAAVPNVVMIVSNDVTIDSRVKKEALTVARMGCRVTVVGWATDGVTTTAAMGDVTILRVPIPTRIKAARTEQRKRAAVPAAPVVGWRSDQDRTAAALRLKFRRAELATDALRRPRPAAPALAVRKARLKAAGLVVRLRTSADRRATAWRAKRDERRGRREWGIRWRRELPEQLDRELALGPVLDALEFDVLHAHDVDMLGVASRAVARARARGREVKFVYDAHEFVAGLSQSGSRTRRVIAAWADHEKEFVAEADRMVTVSPTMADALVERYRLPHRPAVVINTPVVDGSRQAPSLRERAGVGDDVRLVVYAGVLTTARGLHTAIDSLAHLPEDVHLAVVCVPNNSTWFVRQLKAGTERDGIGHRVHFVNPVHPGQVVDYLREADIGCFPGLRFRSHEVTLPNKLFEYLYAGLPLVVSDLTAQAALVRENGVGEVFAVENPADMARAVSAVLDDLDTYRKAVHDPAFRERYSWARQEESLRALYQELLGRELPWAHPEDDAAGSLTEGERIPAGPLG